MDTAEYTLLGKLSTVASKYRLDPVILRGEFDFSYDNEYKVRLRIPAYIDEAKTADYIKLHKALKTAGMPLVELGELDNLQSFLSAAIPLKAMSDALNSAIQLAPPVRPGLNE